MCGEQYRSRVIPGPTAVASAVAVSGLSTRRFTFEGFLPVAKKERAERLESSERDSSYAYEAPHKLRQTLTTFPVSWR